MELIPILSTIILVATISTFILAIGAYILYKIREGRAKQYQEKKTEPLKAELVAPVKLHEQRLSVEEVAVPSKRMTTEERYKIEASERNRFEKPFVGNSINESSNKVSYEIEEHKVKMPETKYKKVLNGDSSKSVDEEINQGEILWR